ncbi:MAG: hypothetical protein HOF89_06390 [Candidatus Nitrosopelagicus sp.]|jgi:hypothetical protein|nr:hypothetical protein [Candidatus Nitrosopelagicus sp.]
MSGCNGVCKKYKAHKPSYQISRYAAGQKNCTVCEIFLEFDGIFCPCCNKQLRCVPKSKNGKEKFLSQIIK